MLTAFGCVNEINRNPAYTVTELASARQHQKTGRPSWSVARWRVKGLAKPAPPKDTGGRTESHSSRAIRVLEGGGHTHLQRVGAERLS